MKNQLNVFIISLPLVILFNITTIYLHWESTIVYFSKYNQFQQSKGVCI